MFFCVADQEGRGGCGGNGRLPTNLRGRGLARHFGQYHVRYLDRGYFGENEPNSETEGISMIPSRMPAVPLSALGLSLCKLRLAVSLSLASGRFTAPTQKLFQHLRMRITRAMKAGRRHPTIAKLGKPEPCATCPPGARPRRSAL